MRRSATLVLIVALALPLTASALTQTERTTLILQLIQKVLELNQQIVALGGTAIQIPSGLAALVQGQAPSNSSGQGSVTACTLERTLALGSRGEDVRCLQRFLISQNLLPSDSATGYFGPLTRAAVIALQRAHNLEQVGHVGRLTRVIVNAAIQSTTVSVTPPTTQESGAGLAETTPPPSAPANGGGETSSPIGTPSQTACSICSILDKFGEQQSCIQDGAVVPHGSSRTFYSTSTVVYPATCASVSQVRTCSYGTLSGSPQYNKASCSVKDATPPSVPTNLTATAISSTQINLSWTASTDTGGSGLAGYKIYRTNTQIATTTATSFQNTGLAPSTSYTYTVAAYDNAGNLSAKSASVTKATLAAPSCTPLPAETKTLACKLGQTGSITQTRTSSCPAGATQPVWSEWQTSSNTCSLVHSVWFAPLWFSSLPAFQSRPGPADFMQLFEPDASWPQAASRVKIFGLYGGRLLPAVSTDAQVVKVVSALKGRGIALAVLAGPLRPDGCSASGGGFNYDIWPTLIKRIKDAGGTIDYVQMDEPYYYGHTYNGSDACHWSADKIATQVREFAELVHATFPDAVIGDVEPLVAADAAGFAEWLDAVKKATGAPLPFLHLDVQWTVADWAARSTDIASVAHSRGVPFGVIYNGDGRQTTNEEWISTAGEHAKEYERASAALGKPDQIIFQSWNANPDRVLPETQPYTFTNFILNYFFHPELLGYPTNVAAGKSATSSKQTAGNEAAKAVDGNTATAWIAGGFAPQWLQIDLGASYALSKVRLLTVQYPAGQTTHTLFVKGAGAQDAWQTLKTFSATTTDNQWLEYVADNPVPNVRFIKIETTKSPSWVGWREVQALSRL